MAKTVTQAKPETEDLMNKLYKCGRFCIDDPHVSIGEIQKNWEKLLSEKDMVDLTQILYGNKKCTPYKKRSRIVDTDFVHGFVEKETRFQIKDITVTVNWADDDDHCEDDDVSNYVRFFISGELPRRKQG